MNFSSLAFAVAALAASAVPAAATTISLTGPPTTAVGTSFDVTLRISNVFSSYPGDALAAFGLNVVIGNAAVLSYTGETIGPLFDDFGGFPGAPNVLGFASAGFLAAGDFTEPLTLATLHFKALTSGSSTINITADLTDPNQGLFYSTAGATPLNGTTITQVTGAAAVPEPSAAILGGLALSGVLFFRRKVTS